MSTALIDDIAQELYLSAMLGSPALFARVQHLLKPSYFDSRLQDGVQFMQEFYKNHRGVPSEQLFAVNTKLKIAPAVLPPQDLAYIAEQVATFCQIRAVTEAVLQAPALIEKGDFGAMVQKIKLATQVQLHSDLGLEYFADPQARLAATDAEDIVIPLGWPRVDELVGGVGRQELLLFTANSGGGKSVAMLNVGFSLMKRGMHGVYITLEMRDRIVARRLDSMISKISTQAINLSHLEVGEAIEAAREQGSGRFFIKRMREGSTTADHIISYLRELEAVHGFRPDFVIVDYIDLCASVQKTSGDNMFTKDKFVTEEIRAIGFDFNCLMISASQLGRGAIVATREEKSIGQDHIQGGISKINTADLVIAIVKDDVMIAAGECRFEFLKTRNSTGVTKKINMRWDEATYLISDLDDLQFKPKAKPTFTMGQVTPGKALGLDDLLKRK